MSTNFPRSLEQYQDKREDFSKVPNWIQESDKFRELDSQVQIFFYFLMSLMATHDTPFNIKWKHDIIVLPGQLCISQRSLAKMASLQLKKEISDWKIRKWIDLFISLDFIKKEIVHDKTLLTVNARNVYNGSCRKSISTQSLKPVLKNPPREKKEAPKISRTNKKSYNTNTIYVSNETNMRARNFVSFFLKNKCKQIIFNQEKKRDIYLLEGERLKKLKSSLIFDVMLFYNPKVLRVNWLQNCDIEKKKDYLTVDQKNTFSEMKKFRDTYMHEKIQSIKDYDLMLWSKKYPKEVLGKTLGKVFNLVINGYETYNICGLINSFLKNSLILKEQRKKENILFLNELGFATNFKFFHKKGNNFVDAVTGESIDFSLSSQNLKDYLYNKYDCTDVTKRENMPIVLDPKKWREKCEQLIDKFKEKIPWKERILCIDAGISLRIEGIDKILHYTEKTYTNLNNFLLKKYG